MSFLEKSFGLSIRTNAIHRFLCASVILWQLFHRHSSTRWPTFLVIKVKFLHGKLLWSCSIRRSGTRWPLFLVRYNCFLEGFFGLGVRTTAINRFLCSSVTLWQLFHWHSSTRWPSFLLIKETCLFWKSPLVLAYAQTQFTGFFVLLWSYGNFFIDIQVLVGLHFW